ncbi:hypothetical protein E4U30_006318 [Claviceps sp. LM220 group G6]|nr:hypothetical protein E4U30_006318 [Claviceps sp. LM220 group G6]
MSLLRSPSQQLTIGIAHRQHPSEHSSIREARTLPSLSWVDVTHFRALTFEDMPNLEVSQARSEPQRSSRGSKRGHRRGQCGRSRSEVSSHRSGSDMRTSSSDVSRIKPGSIAAPITGSTSASGSGRSGIINPRSRDRRLRGQCQSGRGGGAAHDIPRPSAQRTFGGRLTSVLEREVGGEPSTLAVSLSGSAPEFVPGRPVSLRVPENLIQSKPKPSKSVADDLGQRIHEDIGNLNYETYTLLRRQFRFLHILVVRLAPGRVLLARIHAQHNATPDHVHHAIWWDYLSSASVVKMKLVGFAERPTTITAGAVRRSAQIRFRAGSTFVQSFAILDFVGNVMWMSGPSAIVVRQRNRCPVLKGKSLDYLTVKSNTAGSKEVSPATNFVSGASIAAFTNVLRLVTPKKKSRCTAQTRQIQ